MSRPKGDGLPYPAAMQRSGMATVVEGKSVIPAGLVGRELWKQDLEAQREAQLAAAGSSDRREWQPQDEDAGRTHSAGGSLLTPRR